MRDDNSERRARLVACLIEHAARMRKFQIAAKESEGKIKPEIALAEEREVDRILKELSRT